MDWARIVRLGFVLALGCCGLSVGALALEQPPVNYTYRIWQMQDGLPEETVQAFAQTKDRYLWIGTTGGLLRFDGARMVLFDRDTTPAFSDNNVFSLSVSSDDALWIATEGGGLIRYKDGAFRAFSRQGWSAQRFRANCLSGHEGTNMDRNRQRAFSISRRWNCAHRQQQWDASDCCARAA